MVLLVSMEWKWWVKVAAIGLHISRERTTTCTDTHVFPGRAHVGVVSSHRFCNHDPFSKTTQFPQLLVLPVGTTHHKVVMMWREIFWNKVEFDPLLSLFIYYSCWRFEKNGMLPKTWGQKIWYDIKLSNSRTKKFWEQNKFRTAGGERWAAVQSSFRQPSKKLEIGRRKWRIMLPILILELCF